MDVGRFTGVLQGDSYKIAIRIQVQQRIFIDFLCVYNLFVA